MTTGIVNARAWHLLEMLADGEFHSGEMLAGRLGVSRASVFNALADVAAYGIQLHRIRGRGYRLASPWQRLDRDEILRWLGKESCKFDIEILPQAASSNSLLLQRAGVDGMTRRAQSSGAGMPSHRLLPQSADSAITSDLASVVDSPSRMASSSTSNVSEALLVAEVRRQSHCGFTGFRVYPVRDADFRFSVFQRLAFLEFTIAVALALA